jgi:agmatine/peptidylarginine deiminase
MIRQLGLQLILFVLFMSAYSQNTPRFVAEWEPAWGTLIRWPLGIPSSLVVELAADDSLYVLVESPYQRDQAIASFTSWGVNLDYCRFLFAPTYSHWTRDWGPHYVFNDAGIGGIADPEFDGYPWVPGCNAEGQKKLDETGNKGLLGWEEDDAVNIILADSFQCPLISLPVYLTGGNIMVDGMGTAISTQQMLDENIPLANANEFYEILHDSTGISNYIVVENPEVHGIQHIDCYAKFLDESRILVKQVDENHPEYACCEALAEDLGSRMNAWGEPYEILRIYCGSYDGDAVAAYTNSLFLNDKILVPLFGIPSDALALQTYAEALPGYEVAGFEWDDWYYYDALHCRTMGIFDRHMLRMVHKPLSGNVIFIEEPKISVYIDDRSEAGLNPGQLFLNWRQAGSPDWNVEPLEPTI